MLISRNLLLRILALLLKPVARFCVRHALRLPDVIEISKQSLVEAAFKELERSGARANGTRVSLMTGVHRKDVQRIENKGSAAPSQADLIMKITGQWQTDPSFLTSDGAPRVLSINADDSEFTALVTSVSREINPRTVLAELERVGAVELSPRGARLVHQSYVPDGDPESGFKIVSRDMDDLLDAAGENVFALRAPPHLHARTEFDKIRDDAVPEIERWFLREGHQFHARVRDFLGQFDQDVNPKPDFKGKTIRASVSAFSFISQGVRRVDKKK